MKIVSWNVNGLRSVIKKGFNNWLAKTHPDILCLQEIKAQIEQIPNNLNADNNFYNLANKKGYSGVGMISKIKPKSVDLTIGGQRFDHEGRFIQLNFPKFSLINLYLPHGDRDKANLDYKLASYNQLFNYLKQLKNQKLILAGDFNIAHQEIDLARPKQNQNNIMFTHQEREKINQLIDMGFVDTFRYFNQQSGNYTWWPYYLKARERNLGWRIDYLFVSKSLIFQVKKAFILKDIYGSDHCPIGIEIKI